MTTRLVMSSLLLALCSCGPIQGYPGPRRPDAEVALVARNCLESGVNDVSINGAAFCMRGITVLPGEHRFFAYLVQRSMPYDCETHQEFDRYGYDACLSEREADISKGDSSPRNCESSWYEKSVTTCTVDYTKYRCDLVARLSAGSRYKVKSYPAEGGRGLALYSSRAARRPAAFDCVETQTWSARE